MNHFDIMSVVVLCMFILLGCVHRHCLLMQMNHVMLCKFEMYLHQNECVKDSVIFM